MMAHTSKVESVGKEKGSNWFQILAIVTSSLTALSVGLSLAWSSPSIPKIISDKEYYDISLEEASYFTVIPPLAAISTSLIFSKLLDVVGRKYLILFMAIPHATAWILISLAKSVYVFYAARIAAGICESCMFTVLPVYIGEIATPKVRGKWGNIMTMFVYMGQFFINVIGGYLSVKHAAYVCLIVPIIFVCSFIFMPESPYYLIIKERFDEAELALQKLRRVENVEEELTILKGDVKRQLSESGTWGELFTIESNRKALYAGIFLRTSQQLCGTATFAVYTQYIFQKSGGNISAISSSIIFAALCTGFSFVAIFTLDRLGRKKSYLYSLAFCGIMLGLEAIYFYTDRNITPLSYSKFNWFPITGMIIYVISFSFGVGMVPTLMLGELFSSSIKAKGLCILNIVFSFEISTITKLFHLLESNFGLYSPFTLFSISSLISVFLSLYLVPETKGKTLEEIQQNLKRNKNPESKTDFD